MKTKPINYSAEKQALYLEGAAFLKSNCDVIVAFTGDVQKDRIGTILSNIFEYAISTGKILQLYNQLELIHTIFHEKEKQGTPESTQKTKEASEQDGSPAYII